jgi:hypothetical protein
MTKNRSVKSHPGKEPIDFTLEEDDINSNPFSTGLPEGKYE